ncbi:hypothetical protein PITC_089440 [Penicillium italicum]|uniref:Uncharacterized protein n=1 Tax=Penicillium italicum TaxID=40296 RepID=A0A0A2LC97_PENIT|nr:hypothetical protein PITC_089440 [Penicillium italicum]
MTFIAWQGLRRGWQAAIPILWLYGETNKMNK